jgi:hypothetical protein
MSADDNYKEEIRIPACFLFYYEGQKLLNRLKSDEKVALRLSNHLLNPAFIFEEFVLRKHLQVKKSVKTEL